MFERLHGATLSAARAREDDSTPREKPSPSDQLLVRGAEGIRCSSSGSVVPHLEKYLAAITSTYKIALFNPLLRAVVQQLYQSDRPWVVDGSKFERAFGWSATQPDQSIPPTVAWFREHANP